MFIETLGPLQNRLFADRAAVVLLRLHDFDDPEFLVLRYSLSPPDSISVLIFGHSFERQK
jgi:hypothetical protein